MKGDRALFCVAPRSSGDGLRKEPTEGGYIDTTEHRSPYLARCGESWTHCGRRSVGPRITEKHWISRDRAGYAERFACCVGHSDGIAGNGDADGIARSGSNTHDVTGARSADDDDTGGDTKRPADAIRISAVRRDSHPL